MPGRRIAGRAYTQLTRQPEKGRHFAAASFNRVIHLVTYPLGVPQGRKRIDDTLVL